MNAASKDDKREQVLLSDEWSEGIYEEVEIQALTERWPEAPSHFHLVGTNRTYAEYLKSREGEDK